MVSLKTQKEERWAWILVGLLVTASLSVIWGVFLTSSFAERDRTLTIQKEKTQAAAKAFATSVASLVGDSRLVLSLLAGEISFHPERDPWLTPEFRTEVDVVRDQSQTGLDIRMVNDRGYQRILGPQIRKSPLFVGDREFFEKQRVFPGAGFFIDRPVFDQATGAWSLDLSVPVPPNHGDTAILTVALGFPRLDSMVEALASEQGEQVALYRYDGALLYRHPLPADFPADRNDQVYPALVNTRTPEGLLDVANVSAFAMVPRVPLWAVVTRSPTIMLSLWEERFGLESIWVALLTAVILASTLGLGYFLHRLRQLRLAQVALARIDPLTGLLNRRAFLERCDQEQLRNSRHPGILSLVMLDLDHFKQVNDQFGHPTGDRVLREFAAALIRTLRVTDVLARIGGEEFAVLMLETDEERAMEIGERIRAEVETIALPIGHLTTSIGVAVWDGGESFEAWFARTDRALYQAKEGGRNRVEAAS